MQYDPAVEAELIKRISDTEAARAELATMLHEEYASDAWAGDDGPQKLLKFRATQAMYDVYGGTLKGLHEALERQHKMKPAPRLGGEAKQLREIRRRWCRNGPMGLDEGERQIFLTEATPEMVNDVPFLSIGADMFNPHAVQLAATDPFRSDIDTGDSAGGHAAPEQWMSTLIRRHRYYGAVAGMSYNFETSNGNVLHSPQKDSTNEEGSAITGQARVTGDPGAAVPPRTLTEIQWGSSWRESNFMGVRLEAFDDLLYDIAGDTMMDGMERLGRGWNREFTTGNTADRPKGIVTEAQIVDGGAGSADDGSGGISYSNLVELEYAINRAYRMNTETGDGGEGGRPVDISGMFGFCMNENVEKQLRLAVEPSSHRPLWLPNLEGGRATQMIPGTINGRMYTVNEHMADGKTNNDLPLMIGKWMHYGVRNVGGPLFFRFWDRTTVNTMSVDFLAISRRDGRARGPFVPTGRTNAGKCEALAVLQVKT